MKNKSSPENSSFPLKTILVRIVHWGIIILCLLYAFWGLDVEQFISIVIDYKLLAIVVASSFSFAGYVALSGRIRALSQGDISFKHSLIGTIIGQGMNNILPAKLGEAVKAMYLAKESNHSTAWFFGLVFWERFFDLNALLLLGLLIVISVNSPFSIGVFSVFMLVAWFSLLAIRQWPAIARGLVQYVPVQIIKKFLLELIEQLIDGLRLSVIAKTSIWTLVIWLLYVGQVAVIFLWAADLELTLTAILVIFVVSGIGMNLAASPGGLGVYEAAIVVSASWFGVGREEALASAIVLHVLQFVPSTVIGLLLMSQFNISFKQLRQSD